MISGETAGTSGAIAGETASTSGAIGVISGETAGTSEETMDTSGETFVVATSGDIGLPTIRTSEAIEETKAVSVKFITESIALVMTLRSDLGSQTEETSLVDGDVISSESEDMERMVEQYISEIVDSIDGTVSSVSTEAVEGIVLDKATSHSTSQVIASSTVL